ncbi:MAG: SDR family NAD(P)-dependent oxidoreductase, partial [Candidatus Latescibacteria bacterium]|nr:SDR family NAD(P)-dependent oxidoreductase [Candidatus Latescibacterota bacterium]
MSLLVNNAGTNTTNRTVTEMAPEDWDRVVDINMTGAFNFFRGVYTQMKEPRDCKVNNIATMAGR